MGITYSGADNGLRKLLVPRKDAIKRPELDNMLAIEQWANNITPVAGITAGDNISITNDGAGQFTIAANVPSGSWGYGMFSCPISFDISANPAPPSLGDITVQTATTTALEALAYLDGTTSIMIKAGLLTGPVLILSSWWIDAEWINLTADIIVEIAFNPSVENVDSAESPDILQTFYAPSGTDAVRFLGHSALNTYLSLNGGNDEEFCSLPGSTLIYYDNGSTTPPALHSAKGGVQFTCMGQLA